jgi:hypothetical protein
MSRDAHEFGGKARERLAAAAADLRWLLDRGYGMRASLALVGDHFRITARQRQFLYRCVSPPGAAEQRRAKLVPPEQMAGQVVWLDGYNCLIISESLLAGGTVLLSDDGVLRDVQGVFGAFRVSPATERAIELLTAVLVCHRPARAVVYLDERMRYAQCVLAHWQQRLAKAELTGWVQTVDNADDALRGADASVIVASSDRQNMDRAARVVDLPRAVAAMESTHCCPGTECLRRPFDGAQGFHPGDACLP